VCSPRSPSAFPRRDLASRTAERPVENLERAAAIPDLGQGAAMGDFADLAMLAATCDMPKQEHHGRFHSASISRREGGADTPLRRSSNQPSVSRRSAYSAKARIGHLTRDDRYLDSPLERPFLPCDRQHHIAIRRLRPVRTSPLGLPSPRLANHCNSFKVRPSIVRRCAGLF